MKNFLKKRWKALLAALVLLGILAAAFYFGGSTPGAQGWKPVSRPGAQQDAAGNTPEVPETPEAPEPPEMPDAPETPETPAVPEMPELPVEPDLPEVPAEPVNPPPDAEITDPNPPEIQQTPGEADPPAPAEPETYTCTISISCASILTHMDWLDSDKAELVPEDGVLLAETVVSFDPGDSVFDVLKQVTQDKKIHMEYTQAPLYNSVYIEGIGNLYEFDCGELSGWMYSVNGSFPSFGCSTEPLENGDVICWLYTCEQGSDIGENR